MTPLHPYFTQYTNHRHFLQTYIKVELTFVRIPDPHKALCNPRTQMQTNATARSRGCCLLSCLCLCPSNPITHACWVTCTGIVERHPRAAECLRLTRALYPFILPSHWNQNTLFFSPLLVFNHRSTAKTGTYMHPHAHKDTEMQQNKLLILFHLVSCRGNCGGWGECFRYFRAKLLLT